MQRDTDIIRKEQIEEMANYYCEYCKRQTGEKFCEHIDDKSCNIFFESELFYNAGYRKADDVRKETAKEVLNDLYYNLQVSVQEKISKSNDYYNILGWIEEIAKEYGVEVEEWI